MKRFFCLALTLTMAFALVSCSTQNGSTPSNEASPQPSQSSGDVASSPEKKDVYFTIPFFHINGNYDVNRDGSTDTIFFRATPSQHGNVCNAELVVQTGNSLDEYFSIEYENITVDMQQRVSSFSIDVVGGSMIFVYTESRSTGVVSAMAYLNASGFHRVDWPFLEATFPFSGNPALFEWEWTDESAFKIICPLNGEESEFSVGSTYPAAPEGGRTNGSMVLQRSYSQLDITTQEIVVEEILASPDAKNVSICAKAVFRFNANTISWDCVSISITPGDESIRAK